jgi:hypothetical protein
MKNFIKKTAQFTIVTVALLLCVIYIPYYIINKESRFIINDHSKIVLFGHSHPECAFNDSLITNFKNLSQSAEPYFYTYQKVRKVLSQNPQIETVLIEYSNNQIDEKMNDWTWGYKYMSNMFPQYFSFMDKADIDLLLKNNSKDFMNCLSIATKKNLFRMFTFNYNFSNNIGGYLRLEKFQTNLTKDTLAVSKNTGNNKSANISAINIEYLKKIIDLCHSKHKKVYMVRSPQHKYYEYLKNEEEYMKIKNTEFSTVELLDFNNFPLADNEFADPGHLNYKGALKFSKWFNRMLNSGLLNSKNKQSLINENIGKVKLSPGKMLSSL